MTATPLASRRLLATILDYTGLVSFALFWPCVQIVTGNQSFQMIGNWSVRAALLLMVASLLLPVTSLVGLDQLLGRSSHRMEGAVRTAAITALGVLLWMQFWTWHGQWWASPLIGGNRIGRYGTIVAGASLAALLAYRGRAIIGRILAFAAIAAPIGAAILFARAPGAAAVAAGSSVARVVDTTRPAAYLIVLDGVSLEALLSADGQVDEVLFPSFHRLARDGTWFRNAVTNANGTMYSLPIVFTGRYHRYLDVSDDSRARSENLYSMVRPYYRIRSHAFETRFCDLVHDQCAGTWFYGKSWADAAALNRAVFAGWIELVTPRPVVRWLRAQTRFGDWWFDWRGPAPNGADAQARDAYFARLYAEQFDRFTTLNATATARGTFNLHWSMLTHFPYVLDSAGAVHGDKHTVFTAGATTSDVAATYANYRRQLRYADRKLGELIHALEAAGLYEDAVLVVTSDHGMDYEGDAGRPEPPQRYYDRVAHVPLFVKGPGFGPGIDDRDAQSVDLLPTLLELLDVPAPKELHGRSLRTPGAPQRLRPFQMFGGAFRPLLGAPAEWWHRPGTRPGGATNARD